MKWLFVFLLIALIETASASEFNNAYNHYAGGKLERLKVCGERCSGTNFVLYLLHKNFPGLTPTGLNEFGHKHYLWWFGTPINKKKLKKLNYTRNDVLLNNSQNCLFVVVVRDPYDWLRSFYLKPYDVPDKLCKGGFFRFVSSKWKLTRSYQLPDGQHNVIDDLNPWTGKPFPNVLKLRKYKMLNYLTLSQLVDNYLFVRYEDVRDNPKDFIDFVASFYNLAKTEQFIPIDTLIDTSVPPNMEYSGPPIPYVRNPYFPIKRRALKFINKQIDWETEKLTGYCMKEEVK